MKRADSSNGLLKCFLLNLVLNSGWGIAAAVLYLFHHWVGLPVILARLVLAAWFLISAGLAILTRLGNESSQIRGPVQKNKNPYSAGSPPIADHTDPTETEGNSEDREGSEP